MASCPYHKILEKPLGGCLAQRQEVLHSKGIHYLEGFFTDSSLAWQVGNGKDILIGVDPIIGAPSSFILP